MHSTVEWHLKFHRYCAFTAQDDTDRCGRCGVGAQLYGFRLRGAVAHHLCHGAHHGLGRQHIVGTGQGCKERWHHDYAIHVGGDVLWLDAYVPERRARKLDGLFDSFLQLHPGDDLGLCPRDEMDTCHRYLGRQCGLYGHRRLGPDPHVQQRKGDVLEIIVRVKVLYAKRKSQSTLPFIVFVL